ncbi:phosphoglycolate phosphatase [Sphingosinicellaceae bacterium]|nr:phosphoglycolate phosphatase [Sphingosinicellaceae bacterium]
MSLDLPELVIFDLDGTLVDTAPDLGSSLNHALASVGRPPVETGTVRHLVGHGARVLIERGLALSGNVDAAVVDQAMPAFMEFYSAHIADGSVPFDGAEQAMDRLAAGGVTLAVCTNKPAALAVQLIAALGWSDRFAAVLGGDSIAVRKPDGRHIEATAQAAGYDLSDAIFVGDTSVDVAAARDAGVPVIIVAFGFAGAASADLGADVVIQHFDELVDTVRQLKS